MAMIVLHIHNPGFAFVCFSAAEEASKALTEMNGKMIGNKPVFVALAQRRDARRNLLEGLYNTRQMRPPAPGMMPMYGAPMMYPGQPMPPQGQFMYPGQMGMRPAMPYPGMTGMQSFGGPGMMQGPGPRGMPRGPAGPRGPRPPMVGGPRPGPGGMMPYGMPQQPGMMRGGPMPQRPYQGGAMNFPQGVRGQPPMGGPMMMPPQQQMGMPPQQQQPVSSMAPAKPTAATAAKPVDDALTPATLSKMSPADQRQIIGERLYMAIQTHPALKGHEDWAAKVTGMLLEMEVSELLHLLESSEALGVKLTEAVVALEQFMEEQQASAGAQ